MTDSSHPQDFEVTRIVSRRVENASTIPSTAIPQSTTDNGTFKNEVVVNSFDDNPCIYLRVGAATQEEAGDQIIRIGNVIVTDDEISTALPTVSYRLADNIESLKEEGQLWYRKTDGAYFVHDGEGYARVNPIHATTELKGIARLATGQETIDQVESDAAVTPFGLGTWLEQSNIVYRTFEGNCIYVNQETGDDRLSNDGKDARHPFQTIERAIIQAALISYREGLNNDIFKRISIQIAPGDYIVDNRPGASLLTDISSVDAEYTGLINPIQVGLITAINFETRTITLSNYTEGFLRSKIQIQNNDGSAIAVVESVNPTDSTIVVNRIEGIWNVGDNVYTSNYKVFNATTGGIIVPRGLSLMGLDVRKNIVRPLYEGALEQWKQGPTDCECSDTGTTGIFLMTGSGYLANITFKDNESILHTHHLCTCVKFASELELTSTDYGYYRKIHKALASTQSPPINIEGYQTVAYEYSIVSTAESNQEVDADGFRAVNTIAGASPYISNCTVLSRFGLEGLEIDGGLVRGFKSFVVERYTNISLQDDPEAFIDDPEAPGGRVYKEGWKHASYKAINGGYAQLVSCFTICSARHYLVESGGELSLANCFTNFGDVAFSAKGFSPVALPQDTGGSIIGIVPPLPLLQEPKEYFIGSFNQINSSSSRLELKTVFNERVISPFTLLPGDLIYVTDLNSIPQKTYEFKLVDEGSLFSLTAEGKTFFNLQSNELFDLPEEERPNLNNRTVFIKRVPDIRRPEDRIYWLRLSLGPQQREPQNNYVIRLDSETMNGRQLSNILYIALIRDKDTYGQQMPEGVYEIALLNGDGQNDPLNDVYVDIDANNPVSNPLDSRTYIATTNFLKGLGYSTDNISSQLVESLSLISIRDNDGQVETPNVEFHRPSTIRAFGTGLEWVGYGNYDSALPRFQTVNINTLEMFSKIKSERNGGRVYNVGMTHDGLFIVGERIIDLRNNEEYDAQALASGGDVDTKEYKNLIVRDRLGMGESSILSFGENSTISLTTSTAVEAPKNSSSYATEDRPGFIQIATDDDLSNDDLAFTPYMAGILPDKEALYATEDRPGFIRIAADTDLSSDDLAFTPYMASILPDKEALYATEDRPGFIEVAPVEDRLSDDKACQPLALGNVENNISSGQGGGIPIGGIIMFSGSTAPVGWGLCDGTVYNGIQSPDLRGRFVIGYNPLDPELAVGQSRDGIPEVPRHSHTSSTETVDQSNLGVSNPTGTTHIIENEIVVVPVKSDGSIYTSAEAQAIGNNSYTGGDPPVIPARCGVGVVASVDAPLSTSVNEWEGITITTGGGASLTGGLDISTTVTVNPEGATDKRTYPPYYVLAYIIRYE